MRTDWPFSSAEARSSCWKVSIRARSAGSVAARMRTASRPALRALPTATVATGTPAGICTIESRESMPSRCLSGTGRLYDGYPHAMARDPHLKVHLYGKELRPGRKVGHVNAYGDDLEDCLERARHAAAWFAGDLGEESE